MLKITLSRFDVDTLYEMIPSPGVLVITASQRGAVTYYKDEVVDDILGFVKQVGNGENSTSNKSENSTSKKSENSTSKKSTKTISCAGVAIHNITSRIYTVAVAIDSIKTRSEAQSQNHTNSNESKIVIDTNDDKGKA